MQQELKRYVPEASITRLSALLSKDRLVVKIKRERKTKHGDYKRLPNGRHEITINSNLNQFRFLITLVHEIAHFETYQDFGQFIKPHGIEWKRTFQRLMLPFLNPEIFPSEVLPLLANHFKNPKASSDTDVKLALALKQFDAPNDKSFIFEVPKGTNFKLYNGRVFMKGDQRRKRFECIEIKSGRMYLFNPNAEVEILNN